MYNKDIVQLCNRPQKTSGLTLKNLKLISEILDTKSKAKTREGLCEAIIKKVYTNRLDGKPDFYNENWGFDKYSCRNVEKSTTTSKTQSVPPPPPPPPPPTKTTLVPPPPPPPPPPKKTSSKKKEAKSGPKWDDVMAELKAKAKKKSE